jgi:molybdopterin-guanine dinucleotide biosynthesis protein A
VGAVTPNPTTVAGMVLTGGSSRRMGLDKTMIPIAGEPCVVRVERAMRSTASPCIEVGPGKTSLPSVLEAEPGRGPLTAIAAGWRALEDRGHVGPVLVVAGDLPLVSEEVLRWLAALPGTCSVVPEVHGRRQPLLARWSSTDLHSAAAAAALGRRALGDLPDGRGSRTVAEGEWATVALPEVFSDIDAPDDLRRLGFHAEYQATLRALRTP